MGGDYPSAPKKHKQRSVLIVKQSPSATIQTIVHEFNHGANRIPAKSKYTAKEVLASEFAAFDAERNRSGKARQGLKADIVESYGLKRTSPESVSDKPRGVPANWVPRFPKGQEKAYQEAYFR